MKSSLKMLAAVSLSLLISSLHLNDVAQGIPFGLHASVNIDILPGDDTNTINIRGMKTISVTIFSSDDFNAAFDIEPETLAFGPTGGEASRLSCKPKDVNGDRKTDLVCRFSMKPYLPLFECGDTVGILYGETTAGRSFEGRQVVVIAPCK